MTAAPYRKIDRNQVYREVARMIENSGNNEVEISSSELAEKFGVQGPTMDYHLEKLVNEGSLALSPRRGKYNRKIYRLPNNANISVSENATEVLTPESTKKFEQFLNNFIQQKESKSTKTIQEPVQEKLELTQETVQEEVPKTEEKPSTKEVKETVETKELSLDQRIERFLNEAEQVHDADMLLQHQDREILSVMNETIHENMVYLKDLSEQLSTIQNKQLIQQLIDDRNRVLKQMERLENELEETRNLAANVKEKYDIEPDRVRFMHQLIISTIDDFVNQPNHAMALSRKEFRSKASKEVSDLVKYVLGLEN